MDKLKKQVSFIEELEKLKKVTRHNKTLDGRFENSAEHSWQGAIMASIFKEYYPHFLNMEKVIRMLLIHDLGEIYAGDTWVYDDKGKLTSHQIEFDSISRSFSVLPKEQEEELKELWLEFETGNGFEAKYARVIDALVPLINHLYVSEPNYNPEKITSEMVYKRKAFIQDESEDLWSLTKEIIELSIAKGLYLR